MLFETAVGAVEGGNARAVLRPETAQGVYTQWRNIHTVTRNRFPIGVASVGRSFRNEISTSNYIFRTREFEQAELQYFCNPSQSAHLQREWAQIAHSWLLGLGLSPSRLRLREHAGADLAHYALATTDIEYLYPFGWGELWCVRAQWCFCQCLCASHTVSLYTGAFRTGEAMTWSSTRLQQAPTCALSTQPLPAR